VCVVCFVFDLCGFVGFCVCVGRWTV